MKLRSLEAEDAEYMLEWMQDENVTFYLAEDFSDITLEQCQGFIFQSFFEQDKNIHYAITDAKDEYIGTISLKNIDRKRNCAEYAIVCRTKAMGKGYAKEATEELFRIAIEEMQLKLLYLNVYDFNVRAQKLYQKVGFEQTEKPDFLQGEYDEKLLWYQKKL